MTPCPTPQQLREVLANHPSGPDEQAVTSHVEACPRCQAALEHLTRAVPAPDSAPPPLGGPRPDFLEGLQQLLPSARLPHGAQDTRSNDPTPENGRGSRAGERWPEVAGYEILGELGRGGMGVVYQARQLRLNRLVAVKMILAGPHAAAHQQARFWREAEAIAAFRHPNIVHVYEVGEQNGQPFFSMEYVDGGSLARRIAATPQDPRAAAELVQTLARAVQAAHERGIVHRDLKPANILLQEIGVRSEEIGGNATRPRLSPPHSSLLAPHSYSPKITDFGLAKYMEPVPDGAANPAPGGLTHSEAVLGSPSYMAPEQAEGRPELVGSTADVYALGAILYELLTGRPPFKAATPLDTVLQVLHEEPVPPRRLQPKLSCDLETICLTCLQKKPGQRYASAAALAEDLRRFLAGDAIQAKPPSLWGLGMKWIRRRPALAALAFTLGAAVLALVAFGVWHNVQLSAQVREVRRQRQRADDTLQQALEAVKFTPKLQGPEAYRPNIDAEQRARLDKALRFYEAILANADNALPEARERSAEAYAGMGQIHRFFGKPQEARLRFEEAMRQWQALVDEFPEEIRYQDGLAEATEGAAQDIDGLERARDLRERIVKREPDAPAQRHRLAVVYNNLAIALRYKNRSQAEAYYLRAIALVEPLVAGGNASLTLPLAEQLTNLGVFYMTGNDLKQAQACFDKALTLLERPLAGTDPEYRARVRALACSNLGSLKQNTGKASEAVNCYQQAVQAMEAVLKVPQNAQFRRILGNAYGGQAMNLMFLKRYAEAVPAWERYLELKPDDDPCLYLISLAHVGSYRRAADGAQALAAKPELSGFVLYQLACVYAVAIPAVRSDAGIPSSKCDRLVDQYETTAVEFLRRAAAAGLFKDPAHLKALEKDEDLQPLRTRTDFQELLRMVKSAVPAKAAGPMSKT
jgi:serine/threonine protein kinase